MADVNANIGVNIDTSDALNQLKNLQRQISQFHQSVAKSSSTAAVAQRDLQKNFVNSVNAIQGFSAELRTVRTSAETFTNSLEKNKFSIQQYFRYAASQTKMFGKSFTAEFSTIEKTAIERVKTLQTQYVKMGRDAQGAMQAIAIRPTVLNMKDLGTQTAIAAQKQVLFNQLIKQGSTNLLNFGKNTQWAGRQLMVGFTLPLATLGMTAGRVFMEMETAALKFKKVYGDLFTAPGETDKALDSIMELGLAYTQYGVAVSDSLEVASDAAAAGFAGVDLQNQTTAALKLSVLGQMELQKALETTIALQNAFNISSKDLAGEIDFLNAVENQTVVSLDDITEAVPRVAPVIQSLGGDVRDLAFFLAAMKEGGVNAAQGANALKSGLASLINPAASATQFLGQLGIDLRGIVARNKNDISGTVVEFAKALDTLDPQRRAQAIEQLFGKFQFARMSALFDNVIKDGSQASRVLDLAGASMADLAELSEKELGVSAASAMNKFRASVEKLKVELAPVGEMFLKIATPFIDFATSALKAFNSLPDGMKQAIGTIITVVGGLGPVLLMTFGLINNGIANMIKFFATVRLGYLKMTGQAKGIGDETQYMTQEQLEAAAAAASLDQAHAGLTQRFTAEKAAVDALRVAYQQAADAGARFAALNPGMMRPGFVAAPTKMAKGGVVSVGGRGNKDTEPALLTPGEAVIPAPMVKQYAPLIEGMIAGNIPGYAQGVMLGMPKSAKSVSKNRDAAEEVYQMFLKSSYAGTAPTNYGHQISPTSGHSFPIFGLGGVYQKGNKQVFVKPVLDEKAAIAEMRSNEISRMAHGLEAPEQRIVVIRDPMDTTRTRRFLALESDLDPKFINNQPMGLFNEEQYFRQLVASLLRVDKDLSGSNVFGNVVADAGPAGVFNRASGLRDYDPNLPSMEDQALINLLGIRGGAKRAFAESTLGMMAGLTPQQYHQRMLAEIQKVLPRLKETIASFKLTDPTEVGIYDDMIRRLEEALGVDWSKFHAIHSAVKPPKPKTPTQAAPQNFANGGMVRGPGGPKDDAIPANLSNGEAVIDAATVKKNPAVIAALFNKKKIQIPGYSENNSQDLGIPSVPAPSAPAESGNARVRAIARYGEKSPNPVAASHMDNATVANLGETLARTAETAEKFNLELLATNKVILTLASTVEQTEDGLRRNIVETTGNIYETPDLANQSVAGGGYVFAGSAIVESSARNSAYEVNAEDGQKVAEGAPTTLEAQVLAGERAASALRTQSDQSVRYAAQLEQMVREGEHATALLSQSNAHEERLAFMKEQSLRVITDSLQGTAGYSDTQSARTRALEILTHYDNEMAKQVALGRTEQEQLQIATALLTDAQTFAAKELVIGPKDEPQVVREVANSRGRAGDPVSYVKVDSEGEERPSKRAYGGKSAAQIAVQNATEVEALGFDLAEANQRTLESGMERFVRNSSAVPNDQIEQAPPAEQFNDEAALAAETNSESERTKRIARDTVDGYAEELKRGEPEVEQAAKETVDAIVKTIRRASSDPAVQADIDRRNQQSTQASRDSANIAAGTPRQPPRRAYAPEGPAKAPAPGEPGFIGPTMDGAGETATKTKMSMDQMMNSFSGLSAAASAVSGILYLFGGEMQGVAGVVSMASGALFGLIQIVRTYQQLQITSLAIAKFEKVAKAVNLAMTTAAAAGTGFFATMISVAGAAVGALVSPVLIVVGVLALLVGGFMLINHGIAESRKQIEGLGAAASLSEDKLNFLAEKFDVTAKSINWADRTAAAAASAGKSSEEQKQVVDLMVDPKFATEFATEISGIKGATEEEAELALQALAMQLSNSGFEDEAVSAIISAIAAKAGQTDLELNFKPIFITDESTANQAAGLAKEAIDAFNKEVSDRQAVLDVGNDQRNANERAAGRLESDPITVAKSSVQQETKAAAGVAKSSIDSLTLAFESGNISADIYNQSLSDLFNSINSAEQPAWMLDSLAEKMGLEDVVSGFTNATDKSLALQAAVAGLDVESEDFKAIEDANKPVNQDDEEVQRKAVAARRRVTSAITAQTKAQEEQNAATRLGNILEEDSIEAESIQASIDAYHTLVGAGMDAELAYQLTGDAAQVAALKAAMATDAINGNTAAVDAFKLSAENLDSLQKEREALNPKGGRGGQKSPFQEAIDKLKEQQEAAKNSITSYAKLRSAGLSVAESSEIAKDSMLAAALASEQVGSARWNQLVTAIRAVKAEEAAWLNTTPEGRAEQFGEVYGKVMDVFNAQEAILEMNNESATATNRKIIESLEKQIEAYERRSSELQRDLDKIAEKEDEINKAYDEKTKALEKVKKLNQDIINQQKSQLSIADALSKGDISAAASAMEDASGRFAESQGDATQRGFEAQRDAQLNSLTENGKTRVQIEAEIEQIKKNVSAIEFGALQNAKDAVKRADELTEAAKENLEVQGLTRTEWENINTRIDASKANAALYDAEVVKALENAKGLVGEWSKLEDTFTTTHVINTVTTTNGVATPNTNTNPAAPLTQAQWVTKLQSEITELRRDFTRAEAAGRPSGGILTQIRNKESDLARIKASPAFAVGGYVSGPGTPTSDSIPAMLSDGEYVIKAASVDKFGTGFLDSVNKGQLPKFRLGGVVSDGGGGRVKKAAPKPEVIPIGAMRTYAQLAEANAAAAQRTSAKSARERTAQVLAEAAAQRQRDALYRQGGTQGFLAGFDSTMAAFAPWLYGPQAASTPTTQKTEFMAAEAARERTAQVLAEAAAQRQRDALYKQGGTQGFLAGFESLMTEVGKNPIVQSAGTLIDSNPILKFQLANLSIPVEIIGAAVKNNIEAEAKAHSQASQGDFLGAFGTRALAALTIWPKSVFEAGVTAFSGVIDSNNTKPSMWHEAGQAAIDANLFNAQNDPEMAALARIIAGTFSIAADPLMYIGVGAVSKVGTAAKTAAAAARTTRVANKPKPDLMDNEYRIASIKEEFASALANPAIVTRRSVASVESMLTDNKTRTLFDTGTSAALADKNTRALFEAASFGSENVGNIIYGYLANKQRLTTRLPFFPQKPKADTFNPFSWSTRPYGDTLIELKKSFLEKVSLTAGDSLENFMGANPLKPGIKDAGFITRDLKNANPKDLQDFAKTYKAGNDAYIEAQFPRFNPRLDIKTIWMAANDARTVQLRDTIKQLGLNIPVKVAAGVGTRQGSVLGNALPKTQKFVNQIKHRFSMFKSTKFDFSEYNPFTNKWLGPEETLAKGGLVKRYAKGGLATNKFAMGGLVSPKYFAMGGLVSPKYFADGGMAQGTDTVPAMLTPGEFVVNKKATDMYGPLLAAMNSSPASNLSMMGAKTFSEPVYNMPSRGYADVGGNVGIYSSSNNSPSLTALDNSVYNYSLSVNVEGTNASANDIANVVMNKIKTIDSQQVRRQVLR